MTTPAAPYSTAHARRSLVQFGIGKACSATAGIAVLLVSLHLMSTSNFGRYIAAMAFLEIFYLVTGFGLSTIAQRYVAEFRLRCPASQFSRFLTGIMLRRFGYALAAVALVVAVSPAWSAVGATPAALAQAPAFYALLVFGCMTRYLDEVFPALLLQAYTQGLLLAGHAVRLAGLLGCAALGLPVHLDTMLHIELTATLVCACGGLLLLWRHAVRNPSTATGTQRHDNPMMPGVIRRFYAVQVLGQVWGPNTGKLIVAQQLGLAATAGYGFSQSIVDMLRNYLPAYLLANWVRPLMVARYLARNDLGEVNAMASLVFKLSLLCIAPMAAFFLAGGDTFLAWISGGKFSEGALLLFYFSVLLACQCLHVVISMVTLTLERGRASVAATVASCIALPLCIAGSAWFGGVGVVGGMVIGECLWIGTVVLLLRREGLFIRLDATGSLKILLSALPAYVAVRLLPQALSPLLFCAIGVALCATLVLLINVFLKPFRAQERDVITRLVPARFFVC